VSGPLLSCRTGGNGGGGGGVTAIVLYPPGSVAATNPPIRLGRDAPYQRAPDSLLPHARARENGSKPRQNLIARTSKPPEPPGPSPEPRQNLDRTSSTEPPRQNLRTSERDPRRFWRFWRGLGEVFGGSEVLGQNLRFCIQNLRLDLYERFTPKEVHTNTKTRKRETPASHNAELCICPELCISPSWLRAEASADGCVKEAELPATELLLT
jgi:hypothetical protein